MVTASLSAAETTGPTDQPLSIPMKTTGNTILLTGGGSGIGRGLAEAFHARGNQVIISGRDGKKLAQVAAANPGMKILTVDMTDAASVRDFAARAVAENPGLNVLVNNAGIALMENVLAPSASQLDDSAAMVATNLLGPIRLTAALLPQLQAQPDAAVVNVSSGLAFVPLAASPTYCATKAALHSYSQSLRYQLKDSSVRVVEIIPPYVQTTLGGERQANDPAAMPLADYIAEVMAIIEGQPDATEVNVEKVKPLRFAADGGAAKHEEFVTHFNDQMVAHFSGH